MRRVCVWRHHHFATVTVTDRIPLPLCAHILTQPSGTTGEHNSLEPNTAAARMATVHSGFSGTSHQESSLLVTRCVRYSVCIWSRGRRDALVCGKFSTSGFGWGRVCLTAEISTTQLTYACIVCRRCFSHGLEVHP